MLIDPLNQVTRHIRRSVLFCDGAGCTDAQLLTLYIEDGEEAAFAALLRRYGPMVWDVCRRVVPNNHDAEDAFQATFLVLVRNAAAIGRRDAVGSWLYGVAYKTAIKARAIGYRRGTRERQLQQLPETAGPAGEDVHEMRQLLHQELSRLPHLYREPIVLCDLQGKTRNEAAAEVGCPPGTLAARHARGRSMLAKRLARHGFSVTSVALAAVLEQSTACACPPLLVTSTLETARRFVAGQAMDLASPNLLALTRSSLEITVPAKFKFAAAIILTAGLVVGATVIANHPTAATEFAFDSAAAPSRADDDDADRPPDPAVPAGPADGSERVVAETKPASPKQGLLRTIRDPGGIHCVCISHDGKYLVTGGTSMAAHIWDMKTGNLVGGPLRHRGIVRGVAISPDDKTIITGSEDGTACLWNASTGAMRGRIMRHTNGVSAVAFSPNGRYVATGSTDTTCRLWDAATGWPASSPLQQRAAVADVAFSPDGRSLVSSNFDGTVIKWAVPEGQELGWQINTRCGVTSLSFSTDGLTVLTGSRDRGARLWDATTGMPRSVPLRLNNYFVNVAFSPDSKTFLTGAFTRNGISAVDPTSVQLWETATARPIAPSFPDQDNLVFHPDGKICVTTGDDLVHVWDMRVRFASEPSYATGPIETLWSALAELNATQAFRAILALADRPNDAVPYLEKQLLSGTGALEPGAPPARSISDPDRILLAPIDAEELRRLRAIQVLEQIGTAQAKKVLRFLGKGPEAAPVIRDARAALQRLEHRP